jgi:hypothetical protein
MNTAERKACPFCREEIPAAARVCPRCRQWLALWSARNPILQGVAALAAFLALLGAGGWAFTQIFQRFQNQPPFYLDHPGAIQVLSRDFNWVETKDGPRLFVTGILTNQSDIAWGAVELECRFHDGTGRMIDAANAIARLTLAPHDDSAFRVTVVPGCLRSNYAAVTLNVATARNTRWPN